MWIKYVNSIRVVVCGFICFNCVKRVMNDGIIFNFYLVFGGMYVDIIVFYEGYFC